VLFLVAAQIKKYDKHSYQKATKQEHVPILVRIPPLKNHYVPSGFSEVPSPELGRVVVLEFWDSGDIFFSTALCRLLKVSSGGMSSSVLHPAWMGQADFWPG
jgi:hypothetical protein